MKKVIIAQAQPIGDQIIEGVTIEIKSGVWIPAPGITAVEYEQLFNDSAQILETALRNSLPGGTYDRLLGLMLSYKSTHFIVSHTR